MSRSYLRDKYMRHMTNINIEHSIPSAHNDRHRLDEMPKNSPSMFIVERIDAAKVSWLQESTSFGGHSIPKGGHRKVSGIIRAKLKKELREQIKMHY